MGLGERDDLADVVLPGQERGHAIQAERDPPVRWNAVPERPQEEPELLLGLFGPDAEHLEHAPLEVRVVDPDAPAAELPAVQREVVGSGSSRLGIEVVRGRRRERVVRVRPRPALLAPFEQRPVRDPRERPGVGGDEPHPFGHQPAQPVQGHGRPGGPVRHDQDEVAVAGLGRGPDGPELVRRQVTRYR